MNKEYEGSDVAPNSRIDDNARPHIEYADSSEAIFEFKCKEGFRNRYLAVRFSPDDEGSRKRDEFYKLPKDIKGLQYYRLVKWLCEEILYFGIDFNEAKKLVG